MKTLAPKRRHRSSIVPDCTEIRELVKEYKKTHGKSGQWIFLEAGIESGFRILRDWESCKSRPFKHTLEALARVFGCEVERLILHDLVEPVGWIKGEPLLDYQSLLLRTLHSREYLEAENREGGYSKVDVPELTRFHFLKDMFHLKLSLAEQELVHQTLCRMGWLQKVHRLDGGYYFARRKWTERECLSAYRSRIQNEKDCFVYAFSLRAAKQDDAAQEEYCMIIESARQIVKAMSTQTDLLLETGDPSIYPELLDLDCKFHLLWAGRDPTKYSIMNVVVGHHRQTFARLIAAQNHLESKRIRLPFGYTSVKDLVSRFHDETSEIFEAFEGLDEDGKGLDDVLELVEAHPTTGWEYVCQAEQLAKITLA